MNLKRVYRGCKIILALAVVLLLVATGGVAWLLTTPYVTGKINDSLEHMLSERDADYRVTVKDSRVVWTGGSPPVSVRLEEVVLAKKTGEPIIHLPAVRVDLSFWHLWVLKIEPRRVLLESPVLHVRKGLQGFALVGENGDLLPFPSEWLEGGSAQDGDVSIPLTGFDIIDGKLSYSDVLQDVHIESPDLDVSWNERQGEYRLELSAPLSMNASDLSISLKASHDMSSQQAVIEGTVEGINPAELCPLFTSCADLPVLDMKLGGTLALHIDNFSELKGAAFSLRGEAGNLGFQPHLPDNIPLKTFSVAAVADEALTRLELKHLRMDMSGTLIDARGTLRQQKNGYDVVLDAEATDMPVNDLYKYWPEGLAPESRLWTITSIRDGMATKAGAKIILKPEDFEPEFFPDSFIDAYVDVKDASVDYIRGFPKAEGVTGKVRFTGETMTAETTAGQALKNTRIPQAKIFFSDLNAPGTPVEIDLALTSDVKDVLEFIAPPRFDFLKRLAVDGSKASGTVEGKIALAFDAFSGDTAEGDGINWDKVRYKIDSSFDKITALRLDKTYVIDNAKGSFSADNDSMSVAMDGAVNGAKSELTYRHKEGEAANYGIKATLTKPQLMQFGMPDVKQLSGRIGVNASISRSAVQQVVKAKIDLAHAAIDFSRLGYEKAAGAPASLVIDTKRAGNNAARDDLDITYTSDALSLNGKASVTRATHELYSLRFDSVRLGRSDLSIAYLNLPDGYQIDAKGNSLDLTKAYGDDSSDETTISNFPPIRLNLDIGTIYMPKDQKIHHAKGYLYCNSSRCEKADIKAGLADNAKMEMAIFHEGGQRKFSLSSDNAGVLARTFDVSDRMQGGTFSLTGAYDDRKAGNPLDGKMLIEKFTLQNAPILGRILNMSSLSGMVETLSSKGMTFDKLRSDFVFVNDVASIKNGRAAGGGIGIAADGEINIGTHRLDLEGSLAPAYMINSFISNIPLIGTALVGGEGQGLFAFNYSVRGSMNDPTVMVNPLSVLTPGFTRKFFDVFDTPPDTSKPDQEARQP